MALRLTLDQIGPMLSVIPGPRRAVIARTIKQMRDREETLEPAPLPRLPTLRLRRVEENKPFKRRRHWQGYSKRKRRR